jgi:hypothetical protein
LTIGHLIGYAIHSDGPLKNDSAAFDKFEKMERRAATSMIDSPRYVSSGTEKDELFNKTIVFPKNSLGIRTAEISAKNGNLSFIVSPVGENTVIYPVGLDAAYKYYQVPGSGHLYALRGYWKARDEFEIEWNMLSRINKYLIDFKIGDNGGQVSIREGTHRIDEMFPVSIVDSK